MSHASVLASLHTSLDELQKRGTAIPAFCELWRSQASLLAALPPRYRDVLEDLLERLEAGSMFAEESCSFSQDDLLANLSIWLQKAEDALG